MSMRDTTRWRQNGISCDHRPGSGTNGYGGRKFVDDKPRSAKGIPASILHYIATGEGAKPAADYVELDGFFVATVEDNRPRCLTDGCGQLISIGGSARWCASCIRNRNAERRMRAKVSIGRNGIWEQDGMYFTQKQAALFLNVSVGTIEKLRMDGKIKTYRAKGTRKVLLLEDEIKSLVEKVSK